MGLSDSFFGRKFGLTGQDLQSYLSEALSRGGEYADLYFEYLATTSLSLDESIVSRPGCIRLRKVDAMRPS